LGRVIYVELKKSTVGLFKPAPRIYIGSKQRYTLHNIAAGQTGASSKKPKARPKIQIGSKVANRIIKLHKELVTSEASYLDRTHLRSLSRGTIDLEEDTSHHPRKERADSVNKPKRNKNMRFKDLNFSTEDCRGQANSNSVDHSHFNIVHQSRPAKSRQGSKDSKLIKDKTAFLQKLLGARRDTDLVKSKLGIAGSMHNTTVEDTKTATLCAEMVELYKEKDYAAAMALGRSILMKSPNALEALYISGLSASMLEKHEAAIKHFEKLLSLDPNYKKNVYLFLSISLKKLGQRDQSLEVLNKAISLYPRLYEAYVFILF